MKDYEQTTEVKERLYYLTLQFVRKYQPRYYKQFTGDLDDLAMDFFCNFLTKKSRVLGKEESLLDKFDLSKKPDALTDEVYFANLVKVSVTRMLIDRSRADSVKLMSIDHFVDEFGDVLVKNFGLSTEGDSNSFEQSIDALEVNKSFVELVKSKFRCLNLEARKNIISLYKECKVALTPKFQRLFDQLVALQSEFFVTTAEGEVCPAQQLTAKTVVAFVPSLSQMVDFDRFSGRARGKIDLMLSVQSIADLSTMDLVPPTMSRVEFLEFQVSYK